VTGQHDARLFAIAHVLADEGPHLVLLDDGDIFEVLAHDGADLVLVARDASHLCDFLQEFFGMVHDMLLVAADDSRVVCGPPMIPQLGAFV
jgi:hypothetical protein